MAVELDLQDLPRMNPVHQPQVLFRFTTQLNQPEDRTSTGHGAYVSRETRHQIGELGPISAASRSPHECTSLCS